MGLDLLHTIILCGLVGLAGFVDSIAGGGGLISLPAYFAMGLPPHFALATNKFSSSFGTLAAVTKYHRAGTIDLRIGVLSAAGALIGAAIGARIALLLSAATINSAMLIIVPSVMVLFLAKDRLSAWKRWRNTLPSSESEICLKLSSRKLVFLSVFTGFVIGTYDGFFGPGTGTFLTIAFSAFIGLDLLQASANARFANLASNVSSLVVFLAAGKVLFPLAIYAAAAGVTGNYIGSMLAIKKGDTIIKPLMTIVLILLLLEIIRRRYFV